MPRVFISYSWDSPEHRDWAAALASRLREDGVESVLDRWHTAPGDQLPAFMETAVRESDNVLIICTPRYKERSDRREGGVGYEGNVITAEVFARQNHRKFIPVLRQGDDQAMPSWLLGSYFVDLRGEPYSEIHYNDLLSTLKGTRPQAPPVANGGTAEPRVEAATPRLQTPATVAKPNFEPIEITGIIVDQVTMPKNDGTAGSALYTVPFRLSRQPTFDWILLFVAAWNRPQRFTSMHRPGIARVVGDTVVLEGTTIGEVERYHRETLMLAVNHANREFSEAERLLSESEARKRAEAKAHKQAVEETAARIKF